MLATCPQKEGRLLGNDYANRVTGGTDLGVGFRTKRSKAKEKQKELHK